MFLNLTARQGTSVSYGDCLPKGYPRNVFNVLHKETEPVCYFEFSFWFAVIYGIHCLVLRAVC